MAQVFFQPQLRDLTGGVGEITVARGSLRQVIMEIDAKFPGVAARLIVDDRLATGLTAAVDGVLSSRGLATVVGEASEVHFLPAIGGGC